MNPIEIPIQSPPQGSRISLDRRGDAVVISGISQGVPLESFSAEGLAVMEKVLRAKERFSSKSSGGDVGELLAQQAFDWSIEISDGRVTFSSGVLPDDCLFTLRDIRRISRSAEGGLVVELSHLKDEKFKTQILTGKLETEEMEWLHESLIQLFELDRDGVAKPQVQGDFNSPPTDNFKLIEQAGGTRVEIQYRPKTLHRILPLAIGALILSLVGFSLLGSGGGGEGLLADLVAMARDHPVWSKVVKYLVIAVLIFVTFRLAKSALGTLNIRVDKNSCEIKKGILGIGVPRTISRSQMTSIEQSTWKERETGAGEIRHSVQYWRLELHGDKSITLLTDETKPRDSDWLGQFLSDWFEVPFVKKSLSDKHR
jgi:hypothetical protein